MGEWEVVRMVSPRVGKHQCRDFPDAAAYGIGSRVRCPVCERSWRRTPQGWHRLLTPAELRRHRQLVVVLALALIAAGVGMIAEWRSFYVASVLVVAACLLLLAASYISRHVVVEQSGEGSNTGRKP
jgi:hypothetical protein